MRRSEVERVAEEIREMSEFGCPYLLAKVIAAWHLREVAREVRRAKGRTVGWLRVVDTRRKFDGTVRGFVCGKSGMLMSAKMAQRETGGRVARVVLAQRGKGSR